MTEWTDIMVDGETTGTTSHINGMFQISAIFFNAKELKVGPMFDRVPSLLPFRCWDEGARDFWLVKRRPLYNKLIARSEPGEAVWRDFWHWCRENSAPEGTRFWCKPLSFDWGFVQSHLTQVGLDMPFHYRYARDLNSFLSGLAGTPEHTDVEKLVPFNGEQHNGLHDTAWQIDQLFYAIRNRA